jgi:hypothetical protein
MSYCRTRQQQAVLRRPLEPKLAAAIGVMHPPVQLGLPAPDGHLQRVQRQVGAQRAGGLPADQEPAEGIDDQGHVHKAGPGRHVGEVGHPELVGSLGGEVPLALGSMRAGEARPGEVGLTRRRGTDQSPGGAGHLGASWVMVGAEEAVSC